MALHLLNTRFNMFQKAILLAGFLPVAFACLRVPWNYEEVFVRMRADLSVEDERATCFTESAWLWSGPPVVVGLINGSVEFKHYRHAERAWFTWLLRFSCSFAVPIGVWAIVMYETRSWRWNRGRCEQCGYDIKSGGQTTCPECGCVRS